jgi:hypothetical protein
MMRLNRYKSLGGTGADAVDTRRSFSMDGFIATTNAIAAKVLILSCCFPAARQAALPFTRQRRHAK